jgi:hypothetical protein
MIFLFRQQERTAGGYRHLLIALLRVKFLGRAASYSVRVAGFLRRGSTPLAALCQLEVNTYFVWYRREGRTLSFLKAVLF